MKYKGKYIYIIFIDFQRKSLSSPVGEQKLEPLR